MARSLDRPIVGALMVAGLIPVALVAGLAVVSAPYGDPSDPESNRAVADALAYGASLEEGVAHRYETLHGWATIPATLGALRDAAREHEDQGFPDEAPDRLDERFLHAGHLGLGVPAEEFIGDRVEGEAGWSRVRWSDEYGFVVGQIGVRSGFVLSDETWWQLAWDTGRYESEVEYLESAGAFGVHVALRIEDPITGGPIGVIDALMTLDRLQRISDRFADTGVREVRMLTDDGQLVAETSSGHAADRIVRLDPVVIQGEGWRAGIGGTVDQGGVRLRDGTARGWMRLGGALVDGWLVIVERPALGGGLDPWLRRWGPISAGALAGLIFVVAGALWLHARVVLRLRRLSGDAVRFGHGEVALPIVDARDDEIGVLAEHLDKARALVARAVRIVARQRAAIERRRE